MKNFTKLLMTVALLATYSCVQDATEDLTPTLSGSVSGSGEVKTLQVALPNPTRTEMGDKVNGKYPVYWSEGDVLAVNGEPTTNIAINETDAGVAVFDLPLGSTIPYHIVYPYPGEDVAVNSGSGLYPVVFAANQMHTEGTFSQGAAPMYTWSDGFSDIQMHHLTTILRFQVKAKAGESVALKYVSVSTVDAEPIAGVFDVYCGSGDQNDEKTGEIVARDGATSTVFYNFENDEYNLTEEVSTFYIAVPHGSYSGFEVNFVANNGAVCVRTFDASVVGEGEAAVDYSLKAGKVREFPEVEFSADSKMMLIGTDADMLNFAEMVKAQTFDAAYDGALLATNIDVSNIELKPIEGFTSTFEGRHFTISGLTAPLFGENTVATISNLKVSGNIVETANSKVGLIARSLAVSGDKVGKVFNCSVEGSIEYKNLNIVVADNLDLVNVGGAVGGVYGAVVSAVESKVDVTVSVAGPDGEALYMPCFGGVVGYSCAMNEKNPVINNCTSAGAIIWDDASTNTLVTPFIGGVAGYANAGTFTDNVNAGVLEIRKPMHDLDWGGVVGAASVSVERCENKGSMTINEQVTAANIGGVIGKLQANADASIKNELKDCVNSGKVNLNENFKIVDLASIGGVVAVVEKNIANVSNCANSGSITYLGECVKFKPTEVINNSILRLGGVIGSCESDKVENCRNEVTAVIDIRGKVSANNPDNSSVTPDRCTTIGGVIGTRLGNKAELGIDVITEKCNNEGNINLAYTYRGQGIVASSACIGLFDSDKAVECNNSGNIVAEVTLPFFPNNADVIPESQWNPNTSQVSFYIAGIFGYVRSACELENCDNSGTLKYDNSGVRTIYISAIASICKKKVTMTACKNSGEVLIGRNVECEYVYAGGLIGATKYATGGIVYPNCSNTGAIKVEATVNTDAKIGGIFGESLNADKGAGTIGIENTGEVSFSGVAKNLYIGGYAGYYDEASHSVQFTSRGAVKFDGVASNIAYVGGYVGEGAIKGSGTFQVVNNGDVKVLGYCPTLYVSGGFAKASLNKDGVIAGLKNTGNIEVPAVKEGDNVPTTLHMGGIFGLVTLSAPNATAESMEQPKRSVFECENTGKISYHGLVSDGVYIGGIAGKATKAPIYNCINNGAIVSTGNAGSLSSRVMENSEKDRATVQLHYHDIAIGGIVGETDSNVLLSSNSATIEHTCTPNPLKIDQWGEMASSRFDIGGIVGRTYLPSTQTAACAITLGGLTNEKTGTITVYGSPECTKQTSSLDWTSDSTQEAQSADIDDPDRTNMRPFYRMNMAGIVGRLHDHGTGNASHFINTCINRANVEVPDAANAKNLNIAGVLADVLSSYTTLTNSHNYGAIRVDNAGNGTSLSTAVRYACYYINLGGVVANCFDFRIRTAEYKSTLIKKTLTFNQCTNEGAIYYGENKASFGQSAGGILAQALNWAEGRSKWRDWAIRAPYSDLTITMNQCENKGDITFYSKAVSLITSYTGTSFAGGMIGSCGQANNQINYQSRFSSIYLRLNSCKNYGNIQFDRSNGNMSPNTNVNCSAVGGLVGYYHGGVGHSSPSLMQYSDRTVDNACNMEIVSGENHGRVWGFSGCIGGIVGLAHWYAKITGTAENPTINTGDVVVARNESAGNAVRRTGYGTKVIYAGGIAGMYSEYYSDTRYHGENTGTNEGWPAYHLGSQYARIENAVNKGAVGATSLAGGIVGMYRSLLVAGQEIAPNKPHKGGIEFCTNQGDVFALEGATSQVGSIVGSYRTLTVTEYSSYKNDETAAIGAKTWPVGVKNCVVGGTILRGANRYTTADAENFMNCIYGESWNSNDFISIVEGKEYDGCTPYGVNDEESSEE